MNEQLDKMLIDCLDALDQGEPLETILSRYPQAAAQLRPLLETAVSLQHINIQPTVAAEQRSKQQFLQTAAAMNNRKASPRPFWYHLQRLFRPAAGLALVCLLLLVVVAPMSAEAVPGDALYTPKRFMENVRLSLTRDGNAKLQLAEQYNQERIAEIESLLASGRTANVTFRGQVEAIGPEVWVIAGLVTQITPETAVFGEPAIGLLAEVSGQTQNGTLSAFTILVPEGGKPTPELPAATPSPITTPTYTPTQEPTTTLTATSTATVTATPTATATATATLAPTSTPTIPPTLTPTETAVAPPTSQPTNTPAPPTNDDNSNDNDNSSDNDDNDDNDNSDDNDDDSVAEDNENDNS